MFSEDDLLPLSGLQHLLFCERQWGLIHIEQQWEENRLTAEGRLLHDRVHDAGTETRVDLVTARGLALRSLRLGLSGQADAVEFHRVPAGPPQGAPLDGRHDVDHGRRAELAGRIVAHDIQRVGLRDERGRRRGVAPHVVEREQEANERVIKQRELVKIL